MTSVADRTANADRPSIAVLCGVEALSAQRWAAGAISLCAHAFRAKRARRGGDPRREFAEQFPRERKDEGQDADDQPADRKSAHGAEVAQKGAGAAAVAAEARRLHARLHHDAEEAEL